MRILIAASLQIPQCLTELGRDPYDRDTNPVEYYWQESQRVSSEIEKRL